MSGGARGQSGYVYQQDYMAFRVLGSVAKGLLLPDDAHDCVDSFKIEGRQTPEGPAWDVAWTLKDGTIHLRECKDTAITREDRKTFYRRVRQELAKGTSPSHLCVGWVTDPGKQGGILQHLADMASLASIASATNADQLPDRVDSAESALAEALYYLSHDTVDEPPASEDTARLLLARSRTDRFRADELAAFVEQLAPTVFQAGTGQTIRNHIQGDLSTRIQRFGSVEYTVQQFLDELHLGQLTLDMAGPLRDILTHHSAQAIAPSITGIVWSCRPQRPPQIWSLAERVDGWDQQRSCVLAGRTGIGKTTSSLQMQAAQALRMNRHHVLRIEAGNVNEDLVALLPRLCFMLCGISATWLIVDGMDQVVRELQMTWRQTLTRLLTLPNLTLVITVREEVLASHDWMQELLSPLPHFAIDQLSEAQVVSEFQAVELAPPRNKALLACLRNLFLLSIYAKTVSDEDSPLTDRGEVTGFDVIKAYWSRRVTTDSQGQRAAGNPTENASAKRAAVGYMADRTLEGALIVERPSDNATVCNGIETLCREGVLANRSTATVTWSHSWLAEYAAIDRVVGRLQPVNVTTITNAVCDIQSDHAARNVAVGGCKWIISRPELGRVEDYLSMLYERKPGLARDALTVLLEDSPRYLQLKDLPSQCLMEAIAMALAMQARQWRDQVASLPDSLFADTNGPALLQIALQYESEMIGNE